MTAARHISLLLAFLLTLIPAAALAQPTLLVCEPASDVLALKSESAAVTAALAETAPARHAWTQAVEAPDTASDHRAAVDAAWESYRRQRNAALSALTAVGNSDAMVKLAESLRDSETADDIRRWFALIDCASRRGNAFADDELARWYWHQRGDGGIAAVQSNRGLALDYAAKAARRGSMSGLTRIAVYIAGSLHQYPGDVTLARNILELCARTDDESCQRALLARSPYDYGLTARDKAFWLHRLATRDGPSFTAQRDAVLATLTADDRLSVEAAIAAWTTQTWSRLEREWVLLRAEILARGSTTVGPDALCATATPWCRGAALAASGEK